MKKFFITFVLIGVMASCSYGRCKDLAKKYCKVHKLDKKECSVMSKKIEQAPSGACEAILHAIEKTGYE